jgi:uncharacterized membrane protein
MGGIVGTAGDPIAQMDQAARSIFEPQLRMLGLSVDSIEGQGISELETSLDKVNDALNHVDSFDKLRFNMTASGHAILVQSGSQWTFERTILPFLLESKARIIDRIKMLRPEQQLSELRSDVENRIDDPTVREELIEVINRRFEEERSTQENLDKEQAQVRGAQVEALEREQRLRIEIRERKWAIYRSFLERESMASVIGALLLTCLGAALIIAMFTHTVTPEIVSSAFLLILGYFFGQTSARSQAEKGSDGK